MSSIPRRLI
jgi:hypothetical protein